jgi:hypothetical protein
LEGEGDFTGFGKVGFEFAFAEHEMPVELSSRVFVLVETLETVVGFHELQSRMEVSFSTQSLQVKRLVHTSSGKLKGVLAGLKGHEAVFKT